MVAPEREVPGIMRQALEQADFERQRWWIIHDVAIYRLQRHAVDRIENDATDNQDDTDQHRCFEQDGLDKVMRDGADDGSRQEGEQDRENKPPCLRA